jgi:hypothetical protein
MLTRPAQTHDDTFMPTAARDDVLLEGLLKRHTG